MPGFKDTVAGRRRYVLPESGEDIGVELLENQSLQSTLERSWYWGSQIFREQLLDRFEKIIDGKIENAGEGMTQLTRDHSEKRGAEILEFAKQHFEMSDEPLQQTVRGDRRRAAIATVLSEQTTLSRKRIAETLKMKSAGNVSQQIIRFSKNGFKGAEPTDKGIPKKS
jgi:hypothetical protein